MVEIPVMAKMRSPQHYKLRELCRKYPVVQESISVRDIIVVFDVPEEKVEEFLKESGGLL